MGLLYVIHNRRLLRTLNSFRRNPCCEGDRVVLDVGTQRKEFTYDGLQRRVRVVEKDSSVTQVVRTALWCDTTICDERDAAGSTVMRRRFIQAEQANGTLDSSRLTTSGSITAATDTLGAIYVRYAFGPYKTPGQYGISMGVVIGPGGAVSASGPINWAMSKAFDSGWKNQVWLQQRRAAGDAGWDNVFAASQNDPECPRN